jgi:hypothetical protein
MIRLIRLVLLAFAAAFGAAEAGAQTTAYAGGSPIVLSVPVSASVGGRCGFGDAGVPAAAIRQENFDKSGINATASFNLNCTGASRVAIVSSNGALVTTATAPTGYANRAPYDVTLNLAGSNGATATATCAASTLTQSGGCTFRGPASTTQGLRLGAASVNQPGSFVRVTAPAASGPGQLVEGTYTDTLTITLSVAP